MATKVGLVYDPTLCQLAILCPKFGDRYAMVMDLLHAYNLTSQLTILPPANDLTLAHLKSFHSSDYLDFLSQVHNLVATQEDEEAVGSAGYISPNVLQCAIDTEEDDSSDTSIVHLPVVVDPCEEFGLVYDCAPFPGVLPFALSAVQASVAAARSLLSGQCRIAINWHGGWHHAKRAEASGYCYLNDCVLACQTLLGGSGVDGDLGFARVLYVDLDVHHGDGVEEAFAIPRPRADWRPGHVQRPRVFTVSLHCSTENGFFPTGSGPLWEPGDIEGGNFLPPLLSAMNIPLHEGCSDLTYRQVFERVLPALRAIYRPEALVVQCGGDALSRDPNRAFNLTAEGGLVPCVQLLLTWGLPTLLLGGGGYHWADTARLWTQITVAAMNWNANQTLCTTAGSSFSLVPVLEEQSDEQDGEHNSLNRDRSGMCILNPDLPLTCEYLTCFGPDYTLVTVPGLRSDQGPSRTEKLVSTLLEHLRRLSICWGDNPMLTVA